MSNIAYSGLFIQSTDLENVKGKLPRRIPNKKLLLQLNPDSINWSLIGKAVTLVVNSYGSNGTKDAYRVGLMPDTDGEIRSLYEKVEPFVMASVTKNATSDNYSSDITMHPLEKPFFIQASFGVCMEDGTIKV